jgi:SEC-C motif domain protein
MKLLLKPSAACPCTSGLAYGDCCGPLHAGEALAQSPETLMRSRYSAYALKLVPYLLQTWHGSTSPGDLDLDASTKWVGLEVLHAEASADAGVVEFIARFKQNGRAAKMQEVSRFVRESGAWLYIDGKAP